MRSKERNLSTVPGGEGLTLRRARTKLGFPLEPRSSTSIFGEDFDGDDSADPSTIAGKEFVRSWAFDFGLVTHRYRSLG